MIWLSASVVRARTSLFLSFFGTLLIAFPSLFQHLPGITPADVVSALLLPLLMLTVSLAVRFASVNLRLQHRNLEAKDRELQALFAESKDRERLLHTILETVDVGIIAVNSNGDRLLTNNRQAQLEAGAIKNNSSEIHGEAQLTLLSQDAKRRFPRTNALFTGRRKVIRLPTIWSGSARVPSSGPFPPPHGASGTTTAGSAVP
ncbi:protein involved in peptidyl-histidine phosphorylation [Arthrobacter sp. Hiyo6]|nr:protein involved in peptidyl-histidine phosphorylation [Arthrobacter sp. Hiyo6]